MAKKPRHGRAATNKGQLSDEIGLPEESLPRLIQPNATEVAEFRQLFFERFSLDLNRGPYPHRTQSGIGASTSATSG